MANLPGNRQDHPRVCGKDIDKVRDGGIIAGSPPRMREGLLLSDCKLVCFRITPARAGRTRHQSKITSRHQDHPRSRGKDIIVTLIILCEQGSPPLAREGPLGCEADDIVTGITPARAGRTITAFCVVIHI